MSSHKLYGYHPYYLSDLFMRGLFSLFDYSEDILKLEEEEQEYEHCVGREADETEGAFCGRERSDDVYQEIH